MQIKSINYWIDAAKKYLIHCSDMHNSYLLYYFCELYFVMYEVVNKVIVYSFHELVHVVTLCNWVIEYLSCCIDV